jgi:hypothetical protein
MLVSISVETRTIKSDVWKALFFSILRKKLKVMASRLLTALASAALLVLWGCSNASDSANSAATRSTASDTPLDRAYRDFLANEEQFAELAAGINDRVSAERAVGRMKELLAARKAIFQRLAELGAEQPPQGIPPQFRDQYQAVQTRKEQIEQRLAESEQGQAVQEFLLAAVGRELEESSEVDLYRISAEVRRHGMDKMVMVELNNREALIGPQHQKMVRMLQETAGALHAEAIIEDDGTYYLVLAPVEDLNAFIAKINLGAVSNVDPAERKFVLTLDPAKVPADAAAQVSPYPGGGAFPPGRFPPGAIPGYPSEGRGGAEAGEISESEKGQIEAARATFAGQHGRDGIVEFHVKNARPFQGPRMAKVLGVITRAGGGRLLRPIPLRSGDAYFFFAGSGDVNALAAAVDLGQMESVDGPGRRIVIVLEEAKVPH